MYLVGYSHTDPEKSCSGLDGVENIRTEDQCRMAVDYVTSSSLNPNARYEGAVVRENEPTGCYLSGNDIYWNTKLNGDPNKKSVSICRSKDRGECTSTAFVMVNR